MNERITARKLVAVFLGILGVLIIVQLGYAIVDSASCIVLGAAIYYAITHTCTKSLSTSESALSILFYMCVIQLPIGFVLSLPSWVWPVGNQWLWLVVGGLTALSAHYCMAKAMLFAEVTTVVTIDFLRLPLIAMVGVLLYQEPFELSLMVGGFLKVAGNFLSLKRKAKRDTMPSSS